MIDWTTSSTASNTAPSQDLTFEKIMEAKRRIDALGPPPPQVRIVESVDAVKNVRPARLYPKRKAKSFRHLSRMRKKWVKRYGMTAEPAIFKIQMQPHGLVTFVVHPALMHQVRTAANGSGGQ